jgi:hypothetical protein
MSELVLVPWVQDSRHNAPKFILVSAYRQVWVRSWESDNRKNEAARLRYKKGGKHGK